MATFHTISSTIPHDKHQFIKAQRNRVLTPKVVAQESMKFLTMNLQHEGTVKHRHHHFKVGGYGTKSKTHKGDMNFTTKRGDKDFHRSRHDVKKKRAPYRKK